MATRVAKNKVSARKKPISAARSGSRVRVQRAQQPSEIAVFLRRYAPMILLVFFAVLTGVVLFLSYRAVTATTIFNLKKVDVAGMNRVDPMEIEQIVKRMATKTGVWNAEIDDIRSEVEKLHWVKSAVVSRVLPDGLRVRVAERIPKAAVKIDGRTFWIDEDGKELDTVNEKETPAIILQGWDEEKSDALRKRNLDRLALFEKLQEEWKKSGLLSRIKAINLQDMQDIEAFVDEGNTEIGIFLGKEDLSKRLETALIVTKDYGQNGNLSDVQYFISKGGSVIAVPKNIAVEKSEKKTSVH